MVKDAIAEDKSLAGPDGKVAVDALGRSTGPSTRPQSEMIKQMAEQVGFNITLEVTGAGRLDRQARQAARASPAASSTIATMRNPVTADDPDGQWRTFYYSTGGYNVAHVDDKDWDTLIDEAAATLDDAKRKQMYIDLEKKAYDAGLVRLALAAELELGLQQEADQLRGAGHQPLGLQRDLDGLTSE